MKYFLLFLMIGLASCGHFRTGESIWGGGLWIVPWLTGVGSIIFMTTAYRSWKSGTKKLRTLTTPESYSDSRIRFLKQWAFWFSVALLIATIAIVWAVNSDR